MIFVNISSVYLFDLFFLFFEFISSVTLLLFSSDCLSSDVPVTGLLQNGFECADRPCEGLRQDEKWLNTLYSEA